MGIGGMAYQLNKAGAANNVQISYGAVGSQINEPGAMNNLVRSFTECNFEDSEIRKDGSNTLIIYCDENIKSKIQTYFKLLELANRRHVMPPDLKDLANRRHEIPENLKRLLNKQ